MSPPSLAAAALAARARNAAAAALRNAAARLYADDVPCELPLAAALTAEAERLEAAARATIEACRR